MRALYELTSINLQVFFTGNSLGGSSGSGNSSGTKNFPKPCSQQINIELMVGMGKLIHRTLGRWGTWQE